MYQEKIYVLGKNIYVSGKKYMYQEKIYVCIRKKIMYFFLIH